MTLNRFKEYLPLVPALVIYGWLAARLDFIQDDAYISYRFVANFLNGHGLVYNIGERVEGFTNFGWVIFMALWGSLGDLFIIASRITGLLCGAGVIVVTYLIARLLLDRSSRWMAWLPVYLVAVNQSLAYWSPAGLETAAFAFMASWSLYLSLKRSPWLIWSITLAVWLRPEGAFVAGLLIFLEAIIHRRLPRHALRCVGVALVLSLPYVAFKLAYFGSVLPNPFYAKTGFGPEQLASGLEYAGRFWSHYGFYGLGMILAAVFWKRLSPDARTVWLFVAIYSAYIVLVGGDVLKVHRFFLPVIGCVAIVNGLAVHSLALRLQKKTQYLVVGMAAVLLLGLTYQLPSAFVDRYNYYERAFLRKMSFLADRLLESDDSDFAVALPTIGIFGYRLLGHDIIDMVGLTDSTIARHPEAPIEGMETTWKERRHNSSYLLTRAPEYIVFSTGIKPSAPAERALCLFPAFLKSYRQTGWFYRARENVVDGTLVTAFKKVRPLEGDFIPTLPVSYVQHYQQGIDLSLKGDYPGAIRHFEQALQSQPRPENPDLLYQMAFTYLQMNRHEEAFRWYKACLAMDSMVFQAQKDLYMYTELMGDTATSAIHRAWVKKLTPWYWPKVKADVEGWKEEARRRGVSLDGGT